MRGFADLSAMVDQIASVRSSRSLHLVGKGFAQDSSYHFEVVFFRKWFSASTYVRLI